MSGRARDGLVRRVLHAIMTEDSFRVVMGGHSAAAGHGNHFRQSYTLQIQRVLEPVFARLGVTMTAHNMGMGGLGTLQNAMGMRDLYGDDIDVLIYDSGYVGYGGFVCTAVARGNLTVLGRRGWALSLPLPHPQNDGGRVRGQGPVHAAGRA
jgi:hypothetical protein